MNQRAVSLSLLLGGPSMLSWSRIAATSSDITSVRKTSMLQWSIQTENAVGGRRNWETGTQT